MKKILVLLALLMSMSISAKVIATVNGYPIYDKEVNAFLKLATNGKAKYKNLSKKDKRALIDRVAVDKLVLKTALKEITMEEKNQIIAGFWLRKRSAKQKVSDKEVKSAYTENKKFFKDKEGKVIPFAKVKDMIKTSLLQKKAVSKMMKKAKIVMGSKSLKKTSNKKSSSSKTSTYTIKSGNTLSGIAAKFNTTTKELRALNGMDKSYVIKVGKKIKVPN